MLQFPIESVEGFSDMFHNNDFRGSAKISGS